MHTTFQSFLSAPKHTHPVGMLPNCIHANHSHQVSIVTMCIYASIGIPLNIVSIAIMQVHESMARMLVSVSMTTMYLATMLMNVTMETCDVHGELVRWPQWPQGVQETPLNVLHQEILGHRRQRHGQVINSHVDFEWWTWEMK